MLANYNKTSASKPPIPARGVHVDLGRPNWIWTTVCTENRRPWLANDEAHELLGVVWKSATKWLVADYIIMPDHLHFFAAPNDISYPFDRWTTYWVRAFRRLHNHTDWRWQANPFHHRLRRGESCREKAMYLKENPVRKGLVQHAQNWPYQGQIHVIRWTGD